MLQMLMFQIPNNCDRRVVVYGVTKGFPLDNIITGSNFLFCLVVWASCVVSTVMRFVH